MALPARLLKLLLAKAGFLSTSSAALAQAGEFLPEVDFYDKLQRDMHLWLQAKDGWVAPLPPGGSRM